jgi:hypothetical protein
VRERERNSSKNTKENRYKYIYIKGPSKHKEMNSYIIELETLQINYCPNEELVIGEEK